MAASARHFGYPFSEEEARRRLSGLVAGLEAGSRRKIRLTLGPNGGLEAEAVEVEPLTEPVPTLLAESRVDPENEWLYHKTDRRGFYEEARARAARRGCREALLRNTRGEVTEGTFTNLFIRSGGAWYTPPVSSGLLPGVYRGALLERIEGAEERELTPADVASAEGVWLCNSVRGLLRARVELEDAG